MKPFGLVPCVAATVAVLALTSCANNGSATSDEAGSQAANILYVCDCGPDCECESVSTEPGDCSCGKVLKGMHGLKVEGTTAILCTCGTSCECELSETDPGLCNCGEPVRKVELEGTGIYFCNCGGACTCNTFSDRPGNCKCGMALKRAG